MYKNIVLDFDGVLAETNEIRFEGFSHLFKEYPVDHVEKLIQFARLNGGLSRYEKVRYFFEKIRHEPISDEKVTELSHAYSGLVKQAVIDADPVSGSVEFLDNAVMSHKLAIVSGSDEEELREVCRARGIDRYFVKILGSPTGKETNLENLLQEMNWDKVSTLFVGDTHNDLDAAVVNGVDFIGRNSGLVDWSSVDSVNSIDDLSQLQSYLSVSIN